MTTMQPLRDEHEGLWPRVETILATARGVGQVDSASIRRGIDAALEFLDGDLIPHALAEDRALYPAVQRIMGAAHATATMSRDHVEVTRFLSDLREARAALTAGDVSIAEANELRRILYGLYALLRVHFAKEEEIYLPLLEEHLSEQEAATLFTEMEHAAAEARGHQVHTA
jgi:iron-sulfur cluster repair protein YtfE (RIC family)